MLQNFIDYFFSLLPHRFKKEDSYKNQSDEGLLERYLRSFGLEMDEEVIPFINNFFEAIGIGTTPESLLINISSNLGYFPSFTTDSTLYRRLLKVALAIYKIKGTFFSYQVAFNALGYEVQIIEDLPRKGNHYDTPLIYDADPPEQYDITCDYCSTYKLLIRPLNSTDPGWTILSDPQLLNLIRLAKFLQPINAVFEEFRTFSIIYLFTENSHKIDTEQSPPVSLLK